jgi:hypothetical protein
VGNVLPYPRYVQQRRETAVKRPMSLDSTKGGRSLAISHTRLKEILRYHPDTGRFFSYKTNRFVGALDEKGYIRVLADGKLYRAHRLAWFYMSGEWPKNQIDHINGDKADNSWNNLRDVVQTLNMLNKHKAHKNNSTYTLGVTKVGDKFYPRLRINGKLIYLGTFSSLEAAEQRYKSFKKEVLDNY